MRRRGGRRRRWGVKRHPCGKIAATETAAGAWFRSASDKLKARLFDPRHGSAAGRLELAGKITQFERLAGEKWAVVKRAWARIYDCPNPNPRAQDLNATGKSIPKDPFDLTDEEWTRVLRTRDRIEEIEWGLRKKAAHLRGWNALNEIFILDREVDDANLALARSMLRRIIPSLGLTTAGADDFQ